MLLPLRALISLSRQQLLNDSKRLLPVLPCCLCCLCPLYC